MSGRKSIYIKEFTHKNPVPNACVLEGLLMSGLIAGPNPLTGEYPKSLQNQCVQMFANIRATLDEAGFSVDHVVKINFWLSDPADREALNEEWLAMFVDAASRPARQVMRKTTDGDAAIVCDMVAYRSNATSAD